MPDTNEWTSLPNPEAPQPQLIPQSRPPGNFDSKIVNPDDPPWGLGGALLVWFLSVCLIVLVPQVFLLPYLFSKGFHFGTPEDVNALLQFAITDKTAVILQVAALLPSHLLTMVLVWALVTRFGKRPFWTTIGWGWAPGFRLWSCVGLGVLLFAAALVVSKLLGAGKPTTLDQIINSSLTARYLLSFFAVATAPFVEEFIYRGVLYAPLQRLVGVPGAVVIVLVLFTVIHVPQYRSNLGVIAAVGLLSVALTLVRAYSRRLLPCIVIHLVFNGIQAVLLVVEPYMQRYVPSPEPITPPASLVLPLLGLLN
ncbi:MAG: CPBP family intramembrane metalloprotease [Acidobacteriota bacterium]|nr:CPBP family intramembrane metalloprotease [Acidobacteriota bacterium]